MQSTINTLEVEGTATWGTVYTCPPGRRIQICHDAFELGA